MKNKSEYPLSSLKISIQSPAASIDCYVVPDLIGLPAKIRFFEHLNMMQPQKPTNYSRVFIDSYFHNTKLSAALKARNVFFEDNFLDTQSYLIKQMMTSLGVTGTPHFLDPSHYIHVRTLIGSFYFMGVFFEPYWYTSRVKSHPFIATSIYFSAIILTLAIGILNPAGHVLHVGGLLYSSYIFYSRHKIKNLISDFFYHRGCINNNFYRFLDSYSFVSHYNTDDWVNETLGPLLLGNEKSPTPEVKGILNQAIIRIADYVAALKFTVISLQSNIFFHFKRLTGIFFLGVEATPKGFNLEIAKIVQHSPKIRQDFFKPVNGELTSATQPMLQTDEAEEVLDGSEKTSPDQLQSNPSKSSPIAMEKTKCLLIIYARHVEGLLKSIQEQLKDKAGAKQIEITNHDVRSKVFH